jgi:hypothetical protein
MFIYGSNFCIATDSPRLFSSLPNDAAVMPLPKEETTPPVTKIYFAIFFHLLMSISFFDNNFLALLTHKKISIFEKNRDLYPFNKKFLVCFSVLKLYFLPLKNTS